mmetsp:Transcript_66576/g.150319  ORF Transcript_66576/g.150319 Transcript_66576/m.150319 type:complete len:252 (+) Transcript_66576:352-1107(+)
MEIKSWEGGGCIVHSGNGSRKKPSLLLLMSIFASLGLALVYNDFFDFANDTLTDSNKFQNISEPENTDWPHNQNHRLIAEAFSIWWQTAKSELNTTILATDLEESRAWANHFTDFIDKSLLKVEWANIVKGHDGAEIDDKKKYVEEYKKKLGGRQDVAEDNLYVIAERAKAFLRETPYGPALTDKPEFAELVKALANVSNVLTWSQGSFGPKAYSPEFLTTYANTMLSEKLWQQPFHNRHSPFENVDGRNR